MCKWYRFCFMCKNCIQNILTEIENWYKKLNCMLVECPLKPKICNSIFYKQFRKQDGRFYWKNIPINHFFHYFHKLWWLFWNNRVKKSLIDNFCRLIFIKGAKMENQHFCMMIYILNHTIQLNCCKSLLKYEISHSYQVK